MGDEVAVAEKPVRRTYDELVAHVVDPANWLLVVEDRKAIGADWETIVNQREIDLAIERGEKPPPSITARERFTDYRLRRIHEAQKCGDAAPRGRRDNPAAAAGSGTAIRQAASARAAPHAPQSPAEPVEDAGKVDGQPADDSADGEPNGWIDSLDFENSICTKLEMKVIGEHDGSDIIEVFSYYHHKTVTIKDIRRLDYTLMLKHFGSPVTQYVIKSDEAGPGMVSQDDVRNAISRLSGYQRANGAKVGPGCWKGRNSLGHENQSVVLVGPGGASLWNGSGKLEYYREPVLEGRVLDISTDVAWYERGLLADYVENCTHDWAKSVISESISIFNRWRWKNQDQAPTVLSGLIMASWIQSLWKWRPQVGTPGPTKAGKTTLFDGLAAIFGNLGVKSSNSSAAGIRQELQSSSKIILCDEFEDSGHRKEILEMIRSAGRGDKVLRGTPGQKGHRYELKNIVWVASIEIGLKREPDKNRFIMLDLIRPEKGKQNQLRTPSPADLYHLGQKMLAIAVRYGCQAAIVAEQLKTFQFANVDSRVIESFSVPAAMIGVACGMSEDKTKELMAQMLKPLESDGISEPDEADLMNSILSSIIDIGRGEKATVAQLLETGTMDSRKHLERCGIGLVTGRDAPRHDAEIPNKEYLFLAQRQVLANLLRGTPWERQSIETLLRRIDGAFPDRWRIAGQKPYGTSIPMDYIRREFIDEC